MGQRISLPTATINILAASTAVSNLSQKILFVGQKTSAGSAVSGELQEDVSSEDIVSLFGTRSHVAQLLRAAKEENNFSQMDVISLDDNGAGVAATGSFTLAGTATEDGTLVFNVGSKQNHSYSVAVTTADTETEIATALQALIAADTTSPFTTADDLSGGITVTASNKGTLGNYFTLQMEGTVAGITNTIVAMNGGATDPSLTTLFDPIEDVRYQSIVYPSVYALATAKTLMTDRFNTDNKILDGIVIKTDTATKTSLVSTYTSENTQQFIIFGNKPVDTSSHKGSAMVEIDDVISSRVAAVRAKRFTDGVSIADITIAGVNGANDSFGGDALRSLPYFNTPFSRLSLIGTGKGFTDSEVSDLNDAGVSVLGNNNANNSIILGEVVTLYKTDAAGNADLSFKYANYVDTMSGIREYFFNNLKSRFAQSRLTEGEVQPGRSMANEAVIRGFIVRMYNTLSGPDYVLTQAGEDALKYFKENLSITLDLSNRKVTFSCKTPIVTQLGTIIGSVQLSFSTN